LFVAPIGKRVPGARRIREAKPGDPLADGDWLSVEPRNEDEANKHASDQAIVFHGKAPLFVLEYTNRCR
jgi:hypothetical protein